MTFPLLSPMTSAQVPGENSAQLPILTGSISADVLQQIIADAGISSDAANTLNAGIHFAQVRDQTDSAVAELNQARSSLAAAAPYGSLDAQESGDVARLEDYEAVTAAKNVCEGLLAKLRAIKSYLSPAQAQAALAIEEKLTQALEE